MNADRQATFQKLFVVTLPPQLYARLYCVKQVGKSVIRIVHESSDTDDDDAMRELR